MEKRSEMPKKTEATELVREGGKEKEQNGKNTGEDIP